MAIIKRAAALGFFDGVHIGHAALLRRLTDVCRHTGLEPAVITFDMMPQNLIQKKTTRLINSPEDRVGLIQRLFGIDEVIFLHFDSTMASLPWGEFIDHLVIEYNVLHMVAGQNFRFGSGAEGNRYLLQHRCKTGKLGCDIVPDVIFDGVVSSSTYIRKLLLEGDVVRANDFLGHAHVLTDTVRSGRRLGSSIGAPTLNMRFAPDVLIPAHGVYATKVFIDDNCDELTGVTNIGVRPTVDSSGLVTVETHIPGFERELYGSRVRVEFYKRLRPEMMFADTDELKAQIQKDCEAAVSYFAAKT